MVKCWVCFVVIAMIAGCASTSSTFFYRVATDNCNCEEYRISDKEHKIDYLFRARYKMQRGIITTIEVEFTNRSRDTLFLDQGTVKISSRNVPYQYNDKFVPLPHTMILPSRSDVVIMTGSDVSGIDDWNKIAGEQLTLTLQGMRLGERALPQQLVTFIPTNPKLGGEK